MSIISITHSQANFFANLIIGESSKESSTTATTAPYFKSKVIRRGKLGKLSRLKYNPIRADGRKLLWGSNKCRHHDQVWLSRSKKC